MPYLTLCKGKTEIRNIEEITVPRIRMYKYCNKTLPLALSFVAITGKWKETDDKTR